MSNTALSEPQSPHPPADMAKPVSSTASELSRLERMARSGLTTLVAAVGELGELAIAGAIVDLLVAMRLGRNPYIDHGYALTTLVIAMAVLGMLLSGVELVARYRSPQRGWALPIAMVPLGRAVRGLLMLAVCLIVLVPKLLVYFLTLTLGIPVIALLRRLGARWATSLIDSFDVAFEPLEKATNHLYNALYFNKIEARGSTFTALFNLPLTLWCLNH